MKKESGIYKRTKVINSIKKTIINEIVVNKQLFFFCGQSTLIETQHKKDKFVDVKIIIFLILNFALSRKCYC